MASTFEVCLEPEDDDKVYRCEGTNLVTRERELVFNADAELHRVAELGGAFEVRSPKKVAKCGCGKSFTVASWGVATCKSGLESGKPPGVCAVR